MPVVVVGVRVFFGGEANAVPGLITSKVCALQVPPLSFPVSDPPLPLRPGRQCAFHELEAAHLYRACCGMCITPSAVNAGSVLCMCPGWVAFNINYRVFNTFVEAWGLP